MCIPPPVPVSETRLGVSDTRLGVSETRLGVSDPRLGVGVFQNTALVSRASTELE